MRDKLGRFIKGHSVTIEMRNKMSVSHSKLTGEKNPFYGKKHSEETKQKISKLKSGKNNHNWNGGKSIRKKGRIFVRVDTGKYIARAHINWMKEHEILIPSGFVIHHRDLDPANDNPDNLILLPKDIHDAAHWALRKGEVI